MSTVTMGDNGDNNVFPKVESPRNFLETDESFWAEVLSTENSGVVSDFSAVDGDPQLQFQLSPLMNMDPVHAYGSNMHDSMDFWFNLFTRAGELPELQDVWPNFLLVIFFFSFLVFMWEMKMKYCCPIYWPSKGRIMFNTANVVQIVGMIYCGP